MTTFYNFARVLARSQLPRLGPGMPAHEVAHSGPAWRRRGLCLRRAWLAAGVTSQVAEVQGLALTTMAKIVATAGAERIRPHLPTLVPALLEALSSLEVGHRSSTAGVHMSMASGLAHWSRMSVFLVLVPLPLI